MDQKKGKIIDTSRFDWIALKVASPERILDWSWGEIRKPETINYRTQRSEKDGLFDERIFGPERDFECYCGKYKGPRFRGIICEKCGVEVTRSIVRRDRMGHIELATPVAHIWFLRSVPSRIALILGTSAIDAEKVVYFAGYIVTKLHTEERDRLLRELESEYKAKVKAVTNDKAQTELKSLMTAAKADIDRIRPGVVLDEMEYHRFSVKYGTFFEAGIGAEAIYTIFKGLDMDKLAKELETNLLKAGAAEREKLNKRLSLVRSMIKANVRPEWMFLTRIPVTPPALRPMVALESGRHATSDVNDLYRRVINRNNRLMKLRDISAPEVILRNEKRILQEAVDALLDNTIRRGGAAFSAQSQAQRRPLKSLADYLKSKQGYFRFNLLGKRVDYSGRSVIVVGPDLDLDECGLPKKMALELFRPFVIAKLLDRELAHNIRGAGRLIEEGIPEVWAILEEVIKGKHVLLNRAPTLHRQGIQAFRPRLIEGNAIQLHPLVCPAFNADFDGDQMAVHVPLSEEAQMEAATIMSAARNVLKPGSGQPVIFEKPLDIALGIYWMTRDKSGEKGEGKFFPSPNAAILAYDFGDVGIHAKILVEPTEGNAKYAQFKGQRFETTIGRLLFNSALPKDYPYINSEVRKKELSKLVDDVIKVYGLQQTPKILDKIKHYGFQFATRSGVSFSFDDLAVPEAKKKIIHDARTEAQEISDQYENGLLTADEKLRLTVEVWQKAIGDIEKEILPALDKNSSVYTMVVSGARGSARQLSQMAGMKGLVTNTKGEVIEFPVVSSMKEGLTPTEYFTTTHGSRKGLTDTALKTAHAGYLTRRLFDVAQDITVSVDDCGAKAGITVRRIRPSGIEADLAKLIVGRVLAREVEAGGKTFKKGTLLNIEEAKMIAATDIAEVAVRSPMGCIAEKGICQKCYGADLATRELIDIGEAVGTIAAQAIGEPGTQLTMRTFHTGGVATIGGDITHGLPRVEELFDKRPPKAAAVLSRVSGEVIEIKEEPGKKTVVILPDVGSKEVSKTRDKIEYEVPPRRVALVKVGSRVERGDMVTDGSVNLDELFELAGPSRLQEYMIDEVSKIYDLQGASVSHKHMEVIIRQMFSRVEVTDPASSSHVVGEMLEMGTAHALNKELEEAGKEPIKYEPLVLGITEVSLNRKSFLSAASFQHTTRTLITAALKGTTDMLTGLKENVIIGRLIPAGTGFKGSKKYEVIQAFQKDRAIKMEAMMADEEARERIADIA
ncbi:DNA-directed RNA polymerase subunit beta' [Patescibacteria group bacterium]|nr:DNA-directed RNA polymerase subunit beta' [Patescibacteria group bacterium]